ncbi:MAG: glycosyltransferase [Bacteroidales bacterium]|nr:glycosyltransferase [Bacteroidales bacterium]
MKPRAIVSVTNDLVTDQRVSRTCNTLQKVGFDVLLVGRKLPESLPLHRNYATKRFRLLFRKKAFFYAEYNLRLFFFLLFHQHNLLIANDLDTALANLFVHQLKKKPFIIDCHEYFCGVPELNNRKKTLRCWKLIEKLTLPKATQVITVNQSIANLFNKEYNLDVKIVRNIPDTIFASNSEIVPNVPCPFIIYQGAVNVDRGIEEMINAMQWLPDFHFLIAGKGDIVEQLQQYVATLEWNNRILFLGELPPETLKMYTKKAVLGISFEKDSCINYHYCLPNKLFDYIQAGIPVLVSNLPEMRHIVEQYQIGQFITSHQAADIATKIQQMYSNTQQMNLFRQNAVQAAKILCWDNESKILENILIPFLKKS